MSKRRGCLTRCGLVLLIALAMLTGVALVVSAEGESVGGFALSPTEDRGFFDYTAKAGDWISDQVLISNKGSEPIDLRVFKSAGHTTADGNWNLRLTDGIADWIIWSDGIYTIPAESGLLVDFAVSIPEGTPDGEFFAGLVAEPNNPPPMTGEGFVISVIPQSGVAVRITVGSPNSCIVAFGEFELLPSGDSLLLKMDLENQGNVHFEGAGSLQVVGPTGVNLHSTTYPFRYFLAGDSTRYQLVIPLLESGEYEFSASMESSNFPGCNASTSQNLTAVEPIQAPEPEAGLLAELFEGLRSATAESERGAADGETGTILDSRAWLGLGLAAGGVVFGTAWIIFFVWLIRRPRKGTRHARGLPPRSDLE